jgi:hypothetical protein
LVQYEPIHPRACTFRTTLLLALRNPRCCLVLSQKQHVICRCFQLVTYMIAVKGRGLLAFNLSSNAAKPSPFRPHRCEAVTVSRRREILHRNAPSIWSISSSDMDETSTKADVRRRRGPAVKKHNRMKKVDVYDCTPMVRSRWSC